MSSPDFPYAKSPAGAPDRYRLKRRVKFTWARPPVWVAMALSKWVCFGDGFLLFEKASNSLQTTIEEGFYFDVSVAPSFPRAMAAACLHDWLYSHADDIAAVNGSTRRRILHCADHWFLAQMSASGFLLARTYFVAVRICGYWFTSLKPKFLN